MAPAHSAPIGRAPHSPALGSRCECATNTGSARRPRQQSRARDRPRSSVSPRRSHPDLDHLGGRLQPRLDAGARGGAALRNPSIPDLVHLVDRADVLQPDRSLQKLRLVGASLGQESVYGGQDFLRLRAHALARGLIRGQAGEIDGVAVDNDLAQSCPDIDAIDGQHSLPLDWYHSYTQLVEPLSSPHALKAMTTRHEL